MSEVFTRPVSTPVEYSKAVVELVNHAQRTIDVLSPELTPVVFSTAELIDAARAFAIRSQHTLMRVLIRNTTPLTRNDHRFLDIAQRLSSKVKVRKLAPDFQCRDDAFVIADEEQFVLRRQAVTWNGFHDSSRPEIARKLTVEFEEMWEHSTTDPGVRRLHI
ncbi:MAG: hypothetical protein KJO54_06320 [Gammaproteobacteria bacterium]|nr:hypothetical protein [Gammaproteobacteria bacterium]NNF61286.1 hypothetical protein [Gammaproteobacteria bacterium]